MARHVMECLGMTRVVVEDGKVVEVGEPRIKNCPLFKKYRNIDEITPDVVRENVEFRMRDFGLFTEDREIRMKDFLSFGISEILSFALRNDLIDVAIIASDGCGTVLVTDPEIAQGLGGRLSGVCETSPINSIIDGVGREMVLSPGDARIDMVAGCEKARGMGFKRIAVTTASADDAEHIRASFEGIVVIAVHTTGVTPEGAEKMFKSCDIITACASEAIKAEAMRHDILQIGDKVPIIGVTDAGMDLMRRRLKEIGKSETDYN